MIRLQSDDDLNRAFPVMQELRTHLPNAGEFIRRVREGEEKAGYILFGLENDGGVVALCGVQPFVTLYYDNVLWVCDLVTSGGARSRGYGAKLLTEVEQWARGNGYLSIALSSGIDRKDAHRFYLDKMKFTQTSHVFMKKLA